MRDPSETLLGLRSDDALEQLIAARAYLGRTVGILIRVGNEQEELDQMYEKMGELPSGTSPGRQLLNMSVVVHNLLGEIEQWLSDNTLRVLPMADDLHGDRSSTSNDDAGNDDIPF